jgi:hypothetical protein
MSTQSPTSSIDSDVAMAMWMIHPISLLFVSSITPSSRAGIQGPWGPPPVKLVFTDWDFHVSWKLWPKFKKVAIFSFIHYVQNIYGHYLEFSSRQPFQNDKNKRMHTIK